MATVQENVYSGNWDAVREAIFKHGGENDPEFLASTFDNSGMNNFQRICAQPDAPLDVIECIVDRDSRNLFQPTRSPCVPLGEENKYTPLHIACESGSATTVRRLLELIEQERIRRHSPRSLSATSATTTEALQDFIPDVCGDFNLLTCVWGSYFAPDVAYANRLEALNSSAEPFDEREFLKEICDNITDLTALKPDRLTTDDAFLQVWEKTMLLLRVANFGSPNEQLEPEVHMIARSGRELVGTWSCPTIVMYAALKLYPEQVFQKDGMGNLPLHVTSSSPYHDVLGYPTWEGKVLRSPYANILFETRMTAMKMLLNVYPEAASVPDRRGRLPVDLAIASGKFSYTIDELIHAAPAALDSPNPETGLDRFMVAASNDASVDVIYTLLRSSPTRVERGIPVLRDAETDAPTVATGTDSHSTVVCCQNKPRTFLIRDRNKWKSVERGIQRWKVRSLYKKPRRRFSCVGKGLLSVSTSPGSKAKDIYLRRLTL